MRNTFGSNSFRVPLSVHESRWGIVNLEAIACNRPWFDVGGIPVVADGSLAHWHTSRDDATGYQARMMTRQRRLLRACRSPARIRVLLGMHAEQTLATYRKRARADHSPLGWR